MEQQTTFEDLYIDFQPKVKRLVLGYVKGQEAIAEDLCQDIFVKIWTKLSDFKGQSAIGTWIYRIAVNTCLMYLRSKKILSAETTNLSQQVEANEDTENKFKMMYACIDSLKPIDKSIILMELQNIPQEEIAQVMAMSHEAIRTRIYRIKNKLTKCVKHVRL